MHDYFYLCINISKYFYSKKCLGETVLTKNKTEIPLLNFPCFSGTCLIYLFFNIQIYIFQVERKSVCTSCSAEICQSCFEKG